MKTNKIKFAGLILLLSLACLLPGQGHAESRQVRIGIQAGAQSGALDSDGTMQCRDASGRVLFTGRHADVEYAAGSLLVNGQPGTLAMTFESRSPIRWNGKPYRGNISLVTKGGGFNVVNTLDVESYLRGVLKIEVNPAWPMEALKAQAIIARTYALRQLGRHGKDGFDLCSTTHCQAYRGMAAEDARLDRAISETRGIVVLYGGQLAQTYYFADGAGWTADVSTVWGGGVPYLSCKPEPVQYNTPHTTWKAVITQESMQKIMNTLKSPIGTVLSVRALQRDGGSRVTMLEIRGTSGTARVKGHSFRMAAGSNLIRSTLFEIAAGEAGIQDVSSFTPTQPPVPATTRGSEDVLITLTRQGAFSSTELMDMLLHPEKREDYIKMALSRGGNQSAPLQPVPANPVPTVRPSSMAPANFTFQGRGWGHGVGLSQWGAKALSENGWNYVAILNHYFTGTTAKAIY